MAEVDSPIEYPARRRRDSRRRRRRRSGRSREQIFAALDLGTNNCRLLIAKPTHEGFRVLDGFSRVVRLGEGLVFSGELSRNAMDRTIAALNICQQKVIRRGVTAGRYVATEACRQAANGKEFLERVEKETGIHMQTITSEEEAELTLSGCMPLLDQGCRYALTFDVGGGSAEILWVELYEAGGATVLDGISLPFGVVTLTERYHASDISPDDYEKMVAEIEAELRPFEQAHGIREKLAKGEVQVLGTAGTVTTIAGIHLGLARYNRSAVDGTWLDLDVVTDVSRTLVQSSFNERAALACIGQNRAELVVAGCGVLEAICRTWPSKRIRVADRGVREGILLDLSSRFAGNGQSKEKSA